MPHVRVVPLIDESVLALCARPYPRHPRGCPNFGKAARCPPRAPLWRDVFDVAAPCYAVYSVFPLGEHVAEMRSRHPGWSAAQLSCVLYWQGRARARLRREIDTFRAAHPEHPWRVEETPEAMGVDVTATMKAVEIALPWPPEDVVYHVALAGVPRRQHPRLCVYDGDHTCNHPPRD